MLHPIKQDDIRTLLDKFDDLYSKCQGVNNICYFQGISIISGKICIVMKFYEGSIGDKMTRLKGGKLPLPYVLRYGINLAQGILELHSKGILVLNLKPFNFLLNETDQAVLGDIGIHIYYWELDCPAQIWHTGLERPITWLQSSGNLK